MSNDEENLAVSATRAALRVLPLTTLPGIWPPSAIAALNRVFRVSVLSWTDLAYPVGTEAGWSEERENALRRLWNAGFTASEIAKSLGVSNRNAVIGKAHRIGLNSNPESDRLTIANNDDVVAHFMTEAAQAAARACLATFPMAVVAASGSSEISARRSAAIFQYAAEAAFLYGGESARDQLQFSIGRDQEDLNRGLSARELIWLPLWVSPNAFGGIRMPGDGSNIWSFWQEWYLARLRGSTTGGLPFKTARGLDLAISAIDRNIWEESAGAIGDEINRLLRKFKLEVDESPTAVPAVDPQTITAIRFSEDNDRPISVSDDFPTNDDRDAVDRHSAVVEAIERLVSDFLPGGRGGNQTAPIVRDVQSLGEALGAAPSTMSLGLAIPRGERLRQTLIVLENKQDDAESLRLPDDFIRDLRVVVSAYNVLVAMDPILEARDRAQISPSLIDREIAPATVAAALSDAVVQGVADQTVPVAFAEEAAIAPIEPSTDNRSSRRFTESFRNFCRAAASRVRAGVSLVWRNKGKIVIATGVAKGAVQWIASHDALLLGLFPPGSSMHELILRIVHVATMLN